jgi:hypothetical protein
MSSESTDEGEVPHYAYLVLRIFPPFPTEIAVLCHHAETNDIFLPGGRVGLSPLSKSNKVEISQVETLLLQIGFKLPPDSFSRIFLYWEQYVSENYLEHKYSLYVADVNFRDFINSFKNIGGAQALVSKIHFQEELFNLKQAGIYHYSTAQNNSNHHNRLIVTIVLDILKFTTMLIENQKRIVSTLGC